MFRRKLCASCKRSEHGGRARGDCVCKCHYLYESQKEHIEEEKEANPKLDEFIEKTNKEWAELHKPVERK